MPKAHLAHALCMLWFFHLLLFCKHLLVMVGHTAKQLQYGKLENIGKKEEEVRMMTMPDGTEKKVKLLPQVTNGFYSPIVTVDHTDGI